MKNIKILKLHVPLDWGWGVPVTGNEAPKEENFLETEK